MITQSGGDRKPRLKHVKLRALSLFFSPTTQNGLHSDHRRDSLLNYITFRVDRAKSSGANP